MSDIVFDGPAQRSELLSVFGTDFPKDARVEFTRMGSVAEVVPDLVMPDWLLIRALPQSVYLGPNHVRVIGERWESAATDVLIRGDLPGPVRHIFPGRPGPDPYTIAFVANPALKHTTGAISADPILTNRPAFVGTVVSCLHSYLSLDEDLFRDHNLYRLIRFVTVFDPRSEATAKTALVTEVDPTYAEPDRSRAATYLAHYGIKADVVVVIHGSTTHTSATSPGTTDDLTHPVTYTYDGVTKSHGKFAAIPGATALSIYKHGAPLPLHEFGHAASFKTVGWVIDAYTDLGGAAINKKKRAVPGGPIPSPFADYEGTPYGVDATRGSIGYPSTWRSYLPEPVHVGKLNLMDDFRLELYPERCVFDKLTRAWLFDRLWAKANR
jgi:hypothetical protein